MKLLPKPTLGGRHVTLQPLLLTHVDALLAAATESRTTYGFTIVPVDRPSMVNYVELALRDDDAGRSVSFVVRDAGGDVVGTTRYRDLEYWSWPGGRPMPPLPAPDAPDALEIGSTWYAERVQRTGVNTEAKLLLCAYAFEVWRVRRITWKTDERNARSRAAIARIGATFEGLLRAHRAGTDDTVRATAHFSMLATEWPACRERLERRLARGGSFDTSPSEHLDRTSSSA
jgi:RimJ/RimL family protein N-acetyltransferase